MRMSDFVVRDAIVPALTATTKDGAIREMVQSLRAAGYFPDGELDDVMRAILRREQLGSTGIGRGIAIPHAKHDRVDRLIGTVALSQPGIAFDSIDREDVHVFVLLVSPQNKPGDHLRALELVVRVMQDASFVRSLRQAPTREAIWDLLNEAQPPWDR